MVELLVEFFVGEIVDLHVAPSVFGLSHDVVGILLPLVGHLVSTHQSDVDSQDRASDASQPDGVHQMQGDQNRALSQKISPKHRDQEHDVAACADHADHHETDDHYQELSMVVQTDHVRQPPAIVIISSDGTLVLPALVCSSWQVSILGLVFSIRAIVVVRGVDQSSTRWIVLWQLPRIDESAESQAVQDYHVDRSCQRVEQRLVHVVHQSLLWHLNDELVYHADDGANGERQRQKGARVDTEAELGRLRLSLLIAALLAIYALLLCALFLTFRLLGLRWLSLRLGLDVRLLLRGRRSTALVTAESLLLWRIQRWVLIVPGGCQALLAHRREHVRTWSITVGIWAWTRLGVGRRRARHQRHVTPHVRLAVARVRVHHSVGRPGLESTASAGNRKTSKSPDTCGDLAGGSP